MAPEAKRQTRLTPQTAAEWLVLAPQLIGIFGLLVMLAVYVSTLAVTGRGVTEAALLTTFGGLLAVGQGAQALAALRTPPPPPDDTRK